ncbi:related to Probable 1,3-beta-glucanosyltransferase GAS3 [Saccharomycodes ludwigii]|uniref:1,3-beta-glucanosyltransferase n=2 Tax=Saccharomycodes ludwigii TaxID=36035 RepID=A0A376B756_9ASCO|nr:related to Probable 1,3-beta-glucanosyltransferase GAS3 [Saccharomycodes ludwigii]
MLLFSICFFQPSNAAMPIHVNGSRFIQPADSINDPATNKVFFIKGIDYQPGGSSGYNSKSNSDALSNVDICLRDTFAFQQLGINTIRVYALNPDLNHDECMSVLNKAGIYLILDVNGPNYGENLNRADPSNTYNAAYLTRIFKFIEAFKNYPNVLGFFSGNEVINDESNYASVDPAYIRAIQRDMKQYIAKHSNRSIPVGYSAADNTNLRLATYAYLQCNSIDGKLLNRVLQESSSDFFGLNSYQWCSGGGSASWQSSGYAILNSSFSSLLHSPILFSEYGCNSNPPRTFTEVSQGVYNGLINTFSGGLVYEYSEENNNYGMVKINPNDNSIMYKQDFINLKNQFAKVSLPVIYESSINNKNDNVIKCDASLIKSKYDEFGVNDFVIVDQPSNIASLIKNGVKPSNVGTIKKDYIPASTFSYDVIDVTGNTLTPTITYHTENQSDYPSSSFVTNTSSLSKIINSQKLITSFATSNGNATSVSHIIVSSFSSMKTLKNKDRAIKLTTDFGLFGLLAGVFLAFL